MDTILIEKQLEKIPETIKKVFFSNSVAEEIAKIGRSNGLLLDQIDSLIEETGYMVIGLKPSVDFVKIIANKLKIDNVAARKISSEINDMVLKDIRNEIIKLNSSEEIDDDSKTTPITPTPPQNLPISDPTPIEKAGRFTIEKPPVGMGSPTQYNESNLDREAVLKDIEDIEKLKNHEESMVDHLLTTPVNNVEKVEVKKPEEIKIEQKEQSPIQKKSYTADPYREPI